ncbi:hypothetical protein [Cellulomonas sp. KH9]|nr:hypothetical protein [Cellulomonas sp. KH9]SFK19725.1 hypothetical protein SAMN05216467_2455 [Cellulomonas sp. KH9]
MKKLTVATLTAVVALAGLIGAPAAATASSQVTAPCCKIAI